MFLKKTLNIHTKEKEVKSAMSGKNMFSKGHSKVKIKDKCQIGRKYLPQRIRYK